MSDENNCWCLYCVAGYPLVCVAESEKIRQGLEKQNKQFKSCIDSQYNVITGLRQENEALKRAVESLKNALENNSNIYRETLKERNDFAAEVERLKKANHESSEIYCQRNLILSQENQKLNREIERLTESNLYLHKARIEEAQEKTNEESKAEPKFKVGDRVSINSKSGIFNEAFGRVLKIRGDHSALIEPDNYPWQVWMPFSILKKIKDSEPLKIGDKVKVGFEGVVGGIDESEPRFQISLQNSEDKAYLTESIWSKYVNKI